MEYTTTTTQGTGAKDLEFDLVRVNRIREQVRRGTYRIDREDVAEQLLAEHLLFAALFGDAFTDTPTP